MIELRLRSGTVVTFDGRVLEIFAATGPSGRFHISQLGLPSLSENSDGSASITMAGLPFGIGFARGEAADRSRLLHTISDAHRAYGRLDVASRTVDR